MPTRRKRVMRFLNTLRNKLTRRKKKLRRSRRRNKPRMSRLRSFLNRNRNRLRTRKNVAKGKNQQLKKMSDCKPKPGILRAPKPTVTPLLRRALQNPKQQKTRPTKPTHRVHTTKQNYNAPGGIVCHNSVGARRWC